MKTVTVDILNEKAIKLLHDLELLQLIRVRNENQSYESEINWTNKYKGAMLKQSITELDNQLNDLRKAWE